MGNPTTGGVTVDRINARPEPKRDRWGRYIIPNPKGDPIAHTRATTIAATIEDQYNLTRWKQRMTAYGIARRNDLHALAATHHPKTDRATFDNIVDKAMAAAESDAAASLGTALHRATETIDAGTPIADMPEQFHERLTAYRQALETAGIEIDPTGIERILVFDNFTTAGTADRVPLILPDGRRVIGDLKTGTLGKWSWLSISIQMAIYANHTATYDAGTNKRGPRIDVDLTEAVIIHLPAQGGPCELYTVDIAQGYDYMLTAFDVREHRKVSQNGARLYQPFNGGTGGETAVGDWLRDRVKAVAAVGPDAVRDLRNRWPDTVPQPLPEIPSAVQTDALAAALSLVERAHGVPFPADRPGTTTQKAGTI